MRSPWWRGCEIKPKLIVSRGFDLRFDLRFEQLPRLIRLGADRNDQSISIDEAMQSLGLSRGQIASVSSHGVGMGLIELGKYKPTNFGLLVCEHDLFFEKIGTLWMMHYLISSYERYIIWNRMTNKILRSDTSVTNIFAETAFEDLRGQFSDKSIDIHVPREIRSFLRAYIEQRFAKLNYLRATDADPNAYTLTDNPAPIPPLVFLATLLVYRDRFQPGATGLEVGTICHADNSPGRLLNRDETEVRALLDELHTAGALTLETRANLDQVRFKPDETWLDVMQTYYETRA
jgi:hypothetical protein